MVDMVPVTSSNVKAVGHDPDTSELHVHFHNGGKYIYQGVTADQHRALTAADSVGGHGYANIWGRHLNGKHPHRPG